MPKQWKKPRSTANTVAQGLAALATYHHPSIQSGSMASVIHGSADGETWQFAITTPDGKCFDVAVRERKD